MTSEEFKRLLVQDLQAIAQRHPGYSNDGVRFTHWVLESVFLLPDSEARAANFDGEHDAGLDGFLIDPNEDLIRLIQCKYSETIERDARDSFTTLPTKLRDPERIARTNQGIYECSRQFVDGLRNNLGIHMTFVFLGTNRPEYADEMNNLIRASLPPEERERYVIEVIGIDELQIRYLARNPFGLTVPPHKTLQFASETVLTYQNQRIEGLVATVNGRNLADFGDKPEMFMANFRYFLDLRKRVNSKISQTIEVETERPNVWAYNNGVTIVCDRFDEPDVTRKTVKIYKPQIVNGCQTVSTLNRPVVHRYSESVSFLVRVVATQDEDLKRKIATYTNSQTKVTDKALRSNDPIQHQLQIQFAHWNPLYFYDCKEGEWDALPPDRKAAFQISPRNFRRILNVDAAKAYLAFHGEPIEAKSSPKLVWDLGPQGLYSTVFPNERRAEELLLPYLLYKIFSDQIESLLSSLGEEPSGDDLLMKEYIVHADTTLLALAGYIIKKKFGTLGREVLEGLIPKVPVFAPLLFERCNAAFKYEVIRARDAAVERGELFNPRNFFLRVEAFRNAKNKINSDIDLLTSEEFYRRCGL